MFGKTAAYAAKNVVSAAQATSANSWDPNKLIAESMKARSKVKQKAMDAEAFVRESAARDDTTKAIAKRDLKIDKAKASVKKTQRKAGLVAAAGQMAAKSLIKTPDPIKLYQRDTSAYQGIIDSTQTQLQTIQQDIKDLQEKGPQVPDYQSIFGGGQTIGVQNTDPVVKTPGTLSPTTGTESPASSVVSSMGFSPKEFNTFKNVVAGIESGGRYDIPGGTNKHYDGKYQLGADAKTDAAKYLNIPNPGHSPEARAAFRSNPQLQEQMFEGYTKANHSYLMGVPEYANASNQRKLEILGYAHNQGMGNASSFLKTGVTGYDGFNTPGTLYIDSVRSAFESQ